MSKKKPTASFRGPSRPIDPRHAPGAPAANKRRDPFGMILIGVSAAFVLVVALLLALQNKSVTTSTTTAGTSAGVPTAGSNADVTTVSLNTVATATAAEVDFLTKVADIPRVSVQDTKALFDASNVKIIDVRVAKDYDIEHIKGAINIPQNDAVKRIAEIPKSGNVVVYCDCPNDEESAGTAKSLQTGGYNNVKVLRGPRALTLWKEAGYPTEVSSK